MGNTTVNAVSEKSGFASAQLTCLASTGGADGETCFGVIVPRAKDSYFGDCANCHQPWEYTSYKATYKAQFGPDKPSDIDL